MKHIASIKSVHIILFSNINIVNSLIFIPLSDNMLQLNAIIHKISPTLISRRINK